MCAAWESLHKATRELASSDCIKHRLTRAFSNHLKDLDVESLPPDVRTEFQRLATKLTQVRPLRGETAVAATVRKMSNDEASACAQEIVELMARLVVQPAPVVRGRPRQVVTLYAAETSAAGG